MNLKGEVIRGPGHSAEQGMDLDNLWSRSTESFRMHQILTRAISEAIVSRIEVGFVGQTNRRLWNAVD